MDFYHGSTISGLTELRPFASPYSNLKESVVYLTTNKQLALHYIWNKSKFPVTYPMLHICDDGKLIFQEMFSGALELFYKGLSGYIYHCVGEYKINSRVGVTTAATSNEPVPIIDCEFIEDVYKKIMEYQEKGTFTYDKFENRPESAYEAIKKIVYREIKRNNLLNDTKHPLYIFYKEKFPKYWEEAEKLNEENML
jgi:hypothetical protein